MGKPISTDGIFIFGAGGILINAANLNGNVETNLNIYKQRSSRMFDLITNSGDIVQFVSITSTDTNDLNLDPSDTDSNLSSKLKNNTFYIKATSTETRVPGFVTALQLNKAILSTGDYVYDIENNLNLGYSVGSGVPDNQKTLVINNNDIAANGTSTANIYIRLYDINNNIVKTTQTVEFKTQDPNVTFKSPINNIRNTGLYSIRAMSSVVTNATIEIYINGVNSGKSVIINFVDPASVPENRLDEDFPSVDEMIENTTL